MKPQSDIPVLRATDDEVLPGNPRSRVILSSAATNWRSLIVEEHHVPYLEWKGGKFVDHVVGVNLGQPVTSEVKTRGRLRRILNKTGSISLFPRPCGTIALHAMAEGPYARCRLSCIADSG